MRWDIEGTDRRSGEEVNIFIHAANREDAIAVAESRNVVVTSAESMPESDLQADIPPLANGLNFAARPPPPVPPPLARLAPRAQPARPARFAVVGWISIVLGALGLIGNIGSAWFIWEWMPRLGSAAASGARPVESLSPQQVRLLLVEAALSVLASIILMMAGQQLTQRSSAARLLARCYAIAQVSLNLIDGFVGMYVGAAVYANLGLPRPDPDSLICTNIIGFIVASVWPVIMLWAVSGPLARAFLREG